MSPQLTEVCVALMQRVPSIVDQYAMQPQADGDASSNYSDDRWQLIRCYTSIWWIFGMLHVLLLLVSETAAGMQGLHTMARTCHNLFTDSTWALTQLPASDFSV